LGEGEGESNPPRRFMASYSWFCRPEGTTSPLPLNFCSQKTKYDAQKGLLFKETFTPLERKLCHFSNGVYWLKELMWVIKEEKRGLRNVNH